MTGFGWLFVLLIACTSYSCGLALDGNFAGRLYFGMVDAHYSEPDFVISPLGVANTLSLILFAANTKAAAEIQQLLRTAGRNESGSDQRIEELPSQNFILKFYTAALVHADIARSFEYGQIASKFLGAEVVPTYFSSGDQDHINSLISKSTDRQIRDMFGNDLRGCNDLRRDSRLMYVNALSFRAVLPPPLYTKKIQFKTFDTPQRLKRVPVIKRSHVVLPYGIVKDLNARVLAIPLYQTRSYLLILLPQSGYSLFSVEQGLYTVDLRRLSSQLNPTVLDIVIPNIVQQSNLELKEPLFYAGVSEFFKGNLSSFPSDVSVSSVRVRTDFVLNSQGINKPDEDLSLPPPENVTNSVPTEHKNVIFEASEPFLYAVVDTRYVYLIGRFKSLFGKDSDKPICPRYGWYKKVRF